MAPLPSTLLPRSTVQSVGTVSEALPAGGRTWTLTTILGSFLSDLEDRYGPRDASYTPLGIEFQGSTPSIWFPGDRRHVAISLSTAASLNFNLAIWQMAHEAVHLLAPGVRGTALVVEEGLARLYQDEIGSRYGLNVFDTTAAYIDAAKTVSALLDLDPNCIRTIRAQQPRFSSWTPRDVQAVVPHANAALCAKLCSKFLE